jgi:ubiquinone/menaquinone biosynthesis C-methylase UbiE
VNTNDEAELQAEVARVSGVYGKYRRSARRRRAWAADNPGNVAIRDELFDRLRVVTADALGGEGPILDVGCGGGYWLRRLIANGVSPARLHGVDILAERLERSALPPEVDLRPADARALPYPDEQFALVLVFTVLSSLASREDARLALTEAGRVTAPGGLVAVYEPRVPQPLNRSTIRVGREDVTDVLGRDVETSTLTALPPLVRRLGRSAPTLYPYLSSCPPLRTHQLMVHQRPPR